MNSSHLFSQNAVSIFLLVLSLTLILFACESPPKASDEGTTALSKSYNYARDTAKVGLPAYEPSEDALTKVADKVDLRTVGKFPPVFNQGQLNSCTANAASAALYFDMDKQGLTDIFIPSRLFIYYNERALEGSIDNNAAVSMHDCIKTISRTGVCKADAWPYDANKYQDKPPQSTYDFAKGHKAIKYHKISANLSHLKACLKDGYPFIFGFKIYPGFESSAARASGIVPMPKAGEKSIGGHAVVAVGYNDSTEQILIRNSWGADWGQGGYGYMPYEYFTSSKDLAFDYWVLRKVSDED